ncbi:hypothetical protein ABW20_dc0110454 [Dactylellina cionopaga]|nr:hypothetical protein ABW20_dc0110454 [Dactylellina cionopaga]
MRPIERFRLPERRIPDRLYRVNYEGSATDYNDRYGFLAADYNPAGPDRNRQFYKSVENHLKWKSRAPSAYISTFSNKAHAENWAWNWQQNHPELAHTVQLVTIEPLGNEYIFSVASILRAQGKPHRADRHWDEYLFFGRIRNSIIVNVVDVDDIDVEDGNKYHYSINYKPYELTKEIDGMWGYSSDESEADDDDIYDMDEVRYYYY